MRTDVFALRHIGINEEAQQEMLEKVQVTDLEQLINETIPNDIRLKKPLQLAPAMREHGFLGHLQQLSEKNKLFKTYIGLG